jgi:bifunctional non-homologous end joining protein LigD
VGEALTVEVDGHLLRLTNLDKVLYPACGFTKGAVLDYYRKVAPVLLAHLHDRPVTFLRAPDGVEGERFYEKHRPRGAPAWVRSIVVAGRERTIDYPVIDSLAALMWAGNLAVLELHVPQWRAGRDARGPQPSDLLVFDLDPGAPAGLIECCRVALALREALVPDGMDPLAKVSGSKGLQVYTRRPPELVREDPTLYPHRLALHLEQVRPSLVVSNMRKSLRPGRVLIDWSQNSPAKATVAPYSLRARTLPSVSCPVTWEEVDRVASGGDPAALRFGPDETLKRLDAHGDLFAPLLGDRLDAPS